MNADEEYLDYVKKMNALYKEASPEVRRRQAKELLRLSWLASLKCDLPENQEQMIKALLDILEEA